MKLCCYFNIPSHYRELIYKSIDAYYDCEWYFEEPNEIGIKEFDESILKSIKRLGVWSLGPFYGVSGLLTLLRNASYSKYLMMGHSRNISLLVFLLLKRILHTKKEVYLWTHGFYGKETRVECLWKKLLLGSADGLFVYGDYAKQIMVSQYGFSPDKIYPIHNSLNYDLHLKIRKNITSSNLYRDHFKNNLPILIFIGRLTIVKKLDLLVGALAVLKNSGEYYNLVFVGDGPIRNELEKQVVSLGLESNVWFYGASYDENVNAELIYNADLCVAPGNIGLTSIHVLTFGCPAISHGDFEYQMPEFESIKDGITGAFFKRDNVNSLAQTIKDWFGQKGYNRESIRQSCFDEIDNKWTPDYQMEVIKKVIK